MDPARIDRDKGLSDSFIEYVLKYIRRCQSFAERVFMAGLAPSARMDVTAELKYSSIEENARSYLTARAILPFPRRTPRA
jgi:hypothetical protein